MKKIFILFLFLIPFSAATQKLPKGFVYLEDIDSSIKSDVWLCYKQ